MITAEIVADSVGDYGDRITTYILTYPRIIHAELMTHRVFSRNAASSRAIPAKRLIKQVRENPFIPIAFQKIHKGMQGDEYLTGEDDAEARSKWCIYAEQAASAAEKLSERVTKQLVNRLLEPFQWYQSLVTATEFDNFFALRCPQYLDPLGEMHRSKKDYLAKWPESKKLFEWLSINQSPAEIHIQALAEAMWDARNESKPVKLKPGEWHIPFGDKMVGVEEANKLKIATARAARISYKTLGDNPEINFSKDVELHDRLKSMKHMSPFEHCARAMTAYEYNNSSIVSFVECQDTHLGLSFDGYCRNFRGFIPYRHFIENNIKV